MKKARATLVFAIALIVLGMSTAFAASATGSGSLTINGERRTFAFNAIGRGGTTATGQAQLNNRDQGVKLHLDINCINVLGSMATVSGVVKHSNDTTVRPGWISVFRVVDNGEGSLNPPDQMSLVFSWPPGTPVNCTTNLALPMQPIEGGNIQVRP